MRESDVSMQIAPISAAQRHFLLVEQGVGAAIVNFLLNAAIAWVAFRAVSTVPMWGQQSIAGDTLGTAFLLPLITCLIVTPVARGRVRRETLAALAWTHASHPRLRYLPRGTLARGVVLGLFCALTAGAAVVAALAVAGVSAMPFGTFVAFKASFAAVLAAVVTPLAAVYAIAPAISRG